MERLVYLNRKVLLIQRYIEKKSMEQKALKRVHKDAAIQHEIAANRKLLAAQFYALGHAKADVRDYIEAKQAVAI